MKKLVQFIIHSKTATYIAALLCACSWWLSLDFQSSWLLSSIISLAYLALGLYLMRVDTRSYFTISGKSTLAGTLFLMGCSLAPQMGTNLTAMEHLALLALAGLLLLQTYRRHDAMGTYFMAFSLIGTASLITPTILFGAPILLICCSLLKSLHLRTGLASLFGILLPYWVTTCVLFLTDTPLPIDEFIHSFLTPPVASTSPQGDALFINGNALSHEILQTLWLLLLTIPSIITTFFSRNILKARTQLNLYFLTIVQLLLAIIIIIFPTLFMTMLPLLLLICSILGGTFFIRNYRGARIYLIVLMIVWLFIIALSAWNNCTIY